MLRVARTRRAEHRRDPQEVGAYQEVDRLSGEERAKTPKSNAQLDRGAFARAMGMAGRPMRNSRQLHGARGTDVSGDPFSRNRAEIVRGIGASPRDVRRSNVGPPDQGPAKESSWTC